QLPPAAGSRPGDRLGRGPRGADVRPAGRAGRPGRPFPARHRDHPRGHGGVQRGGRVAGRDVQDPARVLLVDAARLDHVGRSVRAGRGAVHHRRAGAREAEAMTIRTGGYSDVAAELTRVYKLERGLDRRRVEVWNSRRTRNADGQMFPSPVKINDQAKPRQPRVLFDLDEVTRWAAPGVPAPFGDGYVPM